MGKTLAAANGRVTLQTIADRLGVSRTTVSNAYSKPDQLAPALREKILETARALGYAGPNAAARTLRLGRSGVIGFLTTTTISYTVTDPAAVQILQGVAEVLDERGMSLLTLPAPRDPRAGIEAARNAVVDGFLVFCVPTDDARLRAILERQLPVVVLDEPRRPDAGYVSIDDRGGARRAAEHLLALGHRAFGVISLPLTDQYRDGFADLGRQAAANFTVVGERFAGYAAALEAARIPWAEVPVYECPDNRRCDGERAAAALLDRANRPTAILATADLLALGAMEAAANRGLHVPRDLSVVGFDDVPEARFGHPPLTTVRQPLQEKGRIAARFVLDGWDGERPPEVIMPTELVVRASSGPVPA